MKKRTFVKEFYSQYIPSAWDIHMMNERFPIANKIICDGNCPRYGGNDGCVHCPMWAMCSLQLTFMEWPEETKRSFFNITHSMIKECVTNKFVFEPDECKTYFEAFLGTPQINGNEIIGYPGDVVMVYHYNESDEFWAVRYFVEFV